MSENYKDIPGTYVFDLQSAQVGYPINKFCETLNRPDGREQFLNNEDEYLQTFGMSDEQIEAIKQRDFNKLLSLGGNIYYLFKIVAVLGHGMQDLGGMMANPPMSGEEFKQMMINGGRSIEGNRSKKEQENG